MLYQERRERFNSNTHLQAGRNCPAGWLHDNVVIFGMVPFRKAGVCYFQKECARIIHGVFSRRKEGRMGMELGRSGGSYCRRWGNARLGEKLVGIEPIVNFDVHFNESFVIFCQEKGGFVDF